MSLINDALRRANQEKKEQAQAPADGAPMQPVQRSSQDRVSFLGPILLTLIVLVLIAAAFLFWKGIETKKELARATAQLQPSPKATAIPAEPKLVVEQTAVNPASEKDGSTPTNSAATNVVATAETNVAPVAPLAPPPLKLQGILFHPSRPTAMINGKTVGIGDLVSGARVLRIDRQEVAVERDGKTEILTLE